MEFSKISETYSLNRSTYINLRWIGIIGQLITINFVKYIFNFEKENYSKKILLFWFFIFLVVTLDLIVEYFFGKNIFGFESYMPGRLAGFLNDELKIGGYYFGFILFTLSYFFYKNKFAFSFLILIFINLFLNMIFLQKIYQIIQD